jgi:hypothetical protein
MKQVHMSFFGSSAAFAVIAGGAGSHDIRPDMQAALVAWNHVIDSEAGLAASTILTCIIVPTKDLATRQLHVGAWAAYLMLKTDHRRSGKLQSDGAKVSTAIRNHRRLAPEDEDDGTARGADIDGLEVRVKNENRFVHGKIAISPIIA